MCFGWVVLCFLLRGCVGCFISFCWCGGLGLCLRFVLLLRDVCFVCWFLMMGGLCLVGCVV